MSKLVLVIILLIALQGTSLGDEINHREEIPMSEILKEIIDGKKIDYDSKIIIGDLKLNESSAGKAVNSPVKITNSSIQGSIQLDGITFENIFDFNRTTFQGLLYINDCKFKKTIYFNNSLLSDTLLFSNSQFLGDAVYTSARFNAKAEWNNCTFFGITSFENCSFNQFAYFLKSEFHQIASFNYAKFRKTANFYYAKFSEVSFIGSQFDKDGTFTGSRFRGDSVYKDVIFKGAAKFDDCKFSEENDALFENTSFKGTLSLNGTRYKNLYIRWYNIDKLAYNEEAYHAIMKNFRDLGYFEDLDSAYYRYRVERRNVPWPGVEDHKESILKLLDLFFEKTYGYGTEPLYAIKWIFIVIIVFAVIWLIIEIRAKRKILGSIQWHSLLTMGFNAISFSVVLFLSSIKPFDKELSISSYTKNPISMQRLLITLERFLGLILSLLFLIALSATVIRPMLYGLV